MKIKKLFEFAGAAQAEGITVIVDVYRAATLSSYLINMGVDYIIPVETKEEAIKLRQKNPDYLLFGEEHGQKIKGFDFGNSPYEILNENFKNRIAVHRTERGTKGIVLAKKATEIIFGSFAVSSAIAKYILQKNPKQLSIVAMDGSGTEDDIFADYLISLLNDDKKLSQEDIRKILINHPGSSRFLDKNHPEFPEQDYYLCTEIDKFTHFPIYRNNKLVKSS